MNDVAKGALLSTAEFVDAVGELRESHEAYLAFEQLLKSSAMADNDKQLARVTTLLNVINSRFGDHLAHVEAACVEMRRACLSSTRPNG